MALINLGKMAKFYKTPVKCRNCGHTFELRIPKGTTIQEHVSNGHGLCERCGCNTLNSREPSPTPTPQPTKPRPPVQPLPAW